MTRNHPPPPSRVKWSAPYQTSSKRSPPFWLLIGQKKFSGTNQKLELRTGLVRHCPQGLFSPFFTFLHAIFFQPFRLSLAPTICSWVSEDRSPCTNLVPGFSLFLLRGRKRENPGNEADLTHASHASFFSFSSRLNIRLPGMMYDPVNSV